MSGYVEREAIKKVYPSKTWEDKVNKMSTQQAIAVYIRLRSQGKLGK